MFKTKESKKRNEVKMSMKKKLFLDKSLLPWTVLFLKNKSSLDILIQLFTEFSFSYEQVSASLSLDGICIG